MSRSDTRRTAPHEAHEAFLSAVIEMSDDAIFSCDFSARISFWSPTAERLFGQPIDQVLNRHFDHLFPSHLRNEAQMVATAVLAGERVRHFETEVLRPDGLPIPVSLSLAPILDENGKPTGAVIVARDVTEQRLAQATLAEVVTRLEEGEELAHIGSWMWDLRTGAVQWSSEFHRIHGVDPLEFDGTFESYLALIHREDRDAVRTAMMESVESGRPLDLEYRVSGSTDHPRTVQVRAQPTFGSAGTPVGLRGIGHDTAGPPAPSESGNPGRPDA
jgi:PAS domain S-box-containing protein